MCSELVLAPRGSAPGEGRASAGVSPENCQMATKLKHVQTGTSVKRKYPPFLTQLFFVFSVNKWSTPRTPWVLDPRQDQGFKEKVRRWPKTVQEASVAFVTYLPKFMAYVQNPLGFLIEAPNSTRTSPKVAWTLRQWKVKTTKFDEAIFTVANS